MDDERGDGGGRAMPDGSDGLLADVAPEILAQSRDSLSWREARKAALRRNASRLATPREAAAGGSVVGATTDPFAVSRRGGGTAAEAAAAASIGKQNAAFVMEAIQHAAKRRREEAAMATSSSSTVAVPSSVSTPAKPLDTADERAPPVRSPDTAAAKGSFLPQSLRDKLARAAARAHPQSAEQ